MRRYDLTFDQNRHTLSSATGKQGAKILIAFEGEPAATDAARIAPAPQQGDGVHTRTRAERLVLRHGEFRQAVSGCRPRRGGARQPTNQKCATRRLVSNVGSGELARQHTRPGRPAFEM